jgi:hypothetical protein
MKHCSLNSIISVIIFGVKKNCPSSGRGLLLYQFIGMAIKLNVVIVEKYHCYKLHTNILLSRLIPYTDGITGDH